MIKTCAYCGKEFDTKQVGSTYKHCSHECRRNAKLQQQRQRRAAKRGEVLAVVQSHNPTCQRCGKELVGRPFRTKYCDECRDVQRLENARRYKKTHRERLRELNRKYKEQRRQLRPPAPPKPPTNYIIKPKVKRRVCMDCGEEFLTENRNKICPDCKHARWLIQQEREEAKRLAQIKADKAAGMYVKTLDDWTREAFECNLDYGTYRALIAAGRTFAGLRRKRTPATRKHIHIADDI